MARLGFGAVLLFALINVCLPLHAQQWSVTPGAQSQDAAATTINGVYNGTYTVAQGPRTLKLSLRASGDGTLAGVFTFYMPPTSHNEAFSYSLSGKFDVASGKFELRPVKWETPPPRNYAMVGMDGAFDPRTGRVAGRITSWSGGSFQATRDQAESVNIANVIAPPRATEAAPPVPQTAAAAAQSWDTSITGVYNGHLICTRVVLNLKLALIAAPDGSLTGFFIVEWPGGIPGYPPPDSGSRFTYKLKNSLPPSKPDAQHRTVGAGFVLTATPWGTPAPSDCSMRYVRGRWNIGSDMISGSIDNPRRSDFHLIRDKAESPTAIAMALQSEPAPTVQASTPPPSSAFSPVTEQLWDLSAGTSVAVVLICRDGPGGLTGMPGPDQAKASEKAAASQPSAAVSAPTDGDWMARATQRLQEHAQGRKWGILTTSVSEDRICASINVALPYKFDSGDAKAAVASISELILKIPRPAGLRINSVNANPPPSLANVAKAKAEAERVAALRAAAPAQLASQGLVRKSKAYWDAYQTDLIRQVFDGGFGYDVDDNTQFQILFGSYVEIFSESCRASLPAHHEAVTITQVTTKKDRYGNVVSQQVLQSWTVEVDSRFASKYRKYSESLGSSRQGLSTALSIISGRVSPSAYFAPGTDMIKFFKTETCGSAAMRQLGENLLRGATGERSLQQVGATVAGAAAETDKSLPPGRFARFVDGCHGFYRDPANARLGGGSHSSAWCDCLGEKYQHLMTRDEEYYYANDFENRFRSRIAEPRSTDPEIPRLHPAVDACIDETR